MVWRLFFCVISALFVVFASPAKAERFCYIMPQNMDFGTMTSFPQPWVAIGGTINYRCDGATSGTMQICGQLNDGTYGHGAGGSEYYNMASNGNLLQFDMRVYPAFFRFSQNSGGNIIGSCTYNQSGSCRGSAFFQAFLQTQWMNGFPKAGTYTTTLGGTVHYGDNGTCNLWADRTINSFTVSVTVSPYCHVVDSTLDFGTLSTITSNIDATANLSITCTPSLPYSIYLENGQNYFNGTRRMSYGGSIIRYSLYSDPARVNRWDRPWFQGDTGTGQVRSIPVYGRVPPQSSPPPGTYSDTVVITITY